MDDTPIELTMRVEGMTCEGCAILEAIRRAFPSERLRIADRGLREGLLMNMMREDGVWRRGGYR